MIQYGRPTKIMRTSPHTHNHKSSNSCGLHTIFHIMNYNTNWYTSGITKTQSKTDSYYISIWMIQSITEGILPHLTWYESMEEPVSKNRTNLHKWFETASTLPRLKKLTTISCYQFFQIFQIIFCLVMQYVTF